MHDFLKESRRQEKRRAERSGGRRTPGSGNGIRKNDVRTDEFSFECKFTAKRSYTLRLDDLLKAEKNALLEGRTMVFEVNIAGHTYMIMTEADWEERIGVHGE